MFRYSVVMKFPGECKNAELKEFAELLKSTGQTAVYPRAIERARVLVFIRDAEEKLVGISAIKRPYREYVKRIFEEYSYFHNPDDHPNPDDFFIESGWSVVVPGHRRIGLAQIMLSLRLRCVNKYNIFATVNTKSHAIQMLHNNGFVCAGGIKREEQNDEYMLFVRKPGIEDIPIPPCLLNNDVFWLEYISEIEV